VPPFAYGCPGPNPGFAGIVSTVSWRVGWSRRRAPAACEPWAKVEAEDREQSVEASPGGRHPAGVGLLKFGSVCHLDVTQDSVSILTVQAGVIICRSTDADHDRIMHRTHPGEATYSKDSGSDPPETEIAATSSPMCHKHTLLSAESDLFPPRSSYLAVRRLGKGQRDMRLHPRSSVRNESSQERRGLVLLQRGHQ